jgi:hypothetical protein
MRRISCSGKGKAEANMDTSALLALHRHFLVADAVKQFMFADVPLDEATADRLGEDLTEAAQFYSRVFRLEVFYGLMYVVVEGNQQLGFQDPAVDGLLSQSQFVDSLRRFRNATFHFHDDPIPKMMEFLDESGSEDWGRDLYRAVKAFFENQLPIKEFFDSLPNRD